MQSACILSIHSSARKRTIESESTEKSLHAFYADDFDLTEGNVRVSGEMT